MRKIKNKDVKKYSIITMLVVIVILIIVGIIYAIKNYNRDDIVTVNTKDVKYTLSTNQLDGVEQPKVKFIDFKTVIRLFQTEKKSILVLSDSTCSNCSAYLPVLTEALDSFNEHAYVLDMTEIDGTEVLELANYLAYDGTPTTFIISNSKVDHVLTGYSDLDTIKSFIDYFYIRNN